MRYKKIIGSILIIINLINFQVSAYASNKNKDKLLIVYNKPNIFQYNNKTVTSIKEFLEKLNIEVETVNERYYKNSTISNFKYVFVFGYGGNFNNENFIKDLKNYTGKICWMGYGIDSYLKENNKYHLNYLGEKENINELYYTNRRAEHIPIEAMDKFQLDEAKVFPVLVSSNKDAKILAYVGDGEREYPFIINEENLWFISQVQDDTILFYVFSDAINDILGIKNIRRGKILVRIKDFI